MSVPTSEQQPNEAAAATLSIGDVAERAGVSPGLLRMWEQRFGFPQPTRLPSGHRRYSDADVEAVREVLARQESGLRLDRAVAAVRALRRVRRALGVRRRARRRPAPAAPAAAQVDPRGALARDRGRDVRARPAGVRLRRVPDGPLLRPRRAAVARHRPAVQVRDGDRGVPRRSARRFGSRAAPGARPAGGRRPAAPGVGRGLRLARLRGRAQRLGAARPAPAPRPRTRVRGGLDPRPRAGAHGRPRLPRPRRGRGRRRRTRPARRPRLLADATPPSPQTVTDFCDRVIGELDRQGRR